MTYRAMLVVVPLSLCDRAYKTCLNISLLVAVEPRAVAYFLLAAGELNALE